MADPDSELYDQRMVTTVVCYLIFAYFMLEEVRNILRDGIKKYVSDPFNIYDLVMYMLLILSVIMHLVFEAESRDIINAVQYLRNATPGDDDAWWRSHLPSVGTNGTIIPANVNQTAFSAKSLHFFTKMSEIADRKVMKVIIDAINVLLVTIKTLEHLRVEASFAKVRREETFTF